MKRRSNDPQTTHDFDPANPWLFAGKAAFLQRIADRVRAGASYYIQGTTALEQLPATLTKLAARYPLNLKKITSERAKRKGDVTFNFLGYVEVKRRVVHWVVLANCADPQALVTTGDRWRDAIETRIEITLYELVRETRPTPPLSAMQRAKQAARAPTPASKAAPKKGASNRPGWTWRYTRRQVESLRETIIALIRGRRDHELEQLIVTLFRSPGFAGIRTQVWKLKALVKSEWLRSRSKSEPLPDMPKNLGFVRRLANVGQPWKTFIHPSTKELPFEHSQTRRRPTQPTVLPSQSGAGAPP